MKEIYDALGKIPDFPKKGILYYDISPVLLDNYLLNKTIDEMSERASEFKPDVIIGLESRGFLFATPIAQKLGLGAAMIRKKGKLPGDVYSYSYELEYGTDTMEIKTDVLKEGQRVVIVDDLLATGGTIEAAYELIKKSGASSVGGVVVIELEDLSGRNKFDIDIKSLVKV